MHGIISLNKPKGITSRQALTKVQRILKEKKAGHAGTLDPIATGVLLICLNEATKISRFLLSLDKTYVVTAKLGERTNTFDAEGTVTERRGVPYLAEAELVAKLQSFVGRIAQKPPMFSAVKIGGSPLYRYARKGLEVERPERTVEIYSLQVTEINLPYLSFEVSCSKGTYIRTLCDDIGIKLGTLAHLVSLQRTSIGIFSIAESASFQDIEDFDPGSEYFCSMDKALSSLNVIELMDDDYCKARNGVQVIIKESQYLYENEFVRLKGPDGMLFGIGVVDSGRIRIARNLNV